MRIVIDLQGAQSVSRFRGIGRYSLSLAQAMAAQAGDHEMLIALNGALVDSVEPLRNAFNGLLPPDSIRVWHPSGGHLSPARRVPDEILRECFLAGLKPDIVHVTSLFEGMSDAAVTSIGRFSGTTPVAPTLYDLIPYIHREKYLADPTSATWYLSKVDQLKRANLLLAISESARREAIEHLEFSPDSVVNISSAADERFHRIDVTPEAERALRGKLGLMRPFVMYTGGIDYRKNIEGLIRAFASLPSEVRHAHQLAVVCSVTDDSRQALQAVARSAGLDESELVLTGFVSDEELVALYNLSTAFVFPSFHEGFGLPLLEAMHCGTPVIAADASSLPEVVGRSDALFNARSDQAMTAKMFEVLTNEAFRADLVRHGYEQARRFSWKESARRALGAFEESARRVATSERVSVAARARRPRMALLTPLPPERSGIATYSTELIPELSRFYEIDVIVAQQDVAAPQVSACAEVRSVDWFVDHQADYERVVYQVGNSQFHAHMFELMRTIPGVVVLHDFFLSGIRAHMALSGGLPQLWMRDLFRSHGYPALLDNSKSSDIAPMIFKYPCNFDVLGANIGLIVHSSYARRLGDEWYGAGTSDAWAEIPHLRAPPAKIDRDGARRQLGIDPDDFVVCSFGHVAPTKLSARLLEAWSASELSRYAKSQLVFVGENHAGDYGVRLQHDIDNQRLGGQVTVTGWADSDTYQAYLAAADVAVQLRTLSRGETSGAVYDCMNYGLATVVNANGAMADLPPHGVLVLNDEFDNVELVSALEQLWRDEAFRKQLGRNAANIVAEKHAPRVCAEQYCQRIEAFYEAQRDGELAMVREIGAHSAEACDRDLIAIAEAAALTFPARLPARQWLIDVTEAPSEGQPGWAGLSQALHEALSEARPGWRVDLIQIRQGDDRYRYARKMAASLLKLPADAIDDDVLEIQQGDFVTCWPAQAERDALQRERVNGLRARGALVDVGAGIAALRNPNLAP
ncbi:glycosyltransferase [Lysobacter sp.]|uniref:glycosyltransferase n=1 Tax=Lysobacter sp. TaxID=72226 RepID=UPI002D390C1C|nr:glycosyltransferase [Lysobacter sp.]HZX78323.1 glycosyltransferase [Lysobacter sp.]